MATYASLAELKSFLRISDTADDALLQIVLDAGTEEIDQALGTTGAQLTPVPAQVKLANLLQSARWYKRQDAPFGVLGGADFGNYSRMRPELDPDVQLMLGDYGERNSWGTVG